MEDPVISKQQHPIWGVRLSLSSLESLVVDGYNPWRIHGAGIYANMTGVYGW